MSNCTFGITANILSLTQHFTFFPTYKGLQNAGVIAQVSNTKPVCSGVVRRKCSGTQMTAC